MPVIRGAVTDYGSLVQISIGWSALRVRKLRMAGMPVPMSVEATALVDTGAEISCLDEKLVAELDLPAEGPVLANVPVLEKVVFRYQHDAGITILHPSGRAHQNLVIANLPVLELPLNTLGYQAIVGRDILQKCVFTFNGPRSQFTLKYERI